MHPPTRAARTRYADVINKLTLEHIYLNRSRFVNGKVNVYVKGMYHRMFHFSLSEFQNSMISVNAEYHHLVRLVHGDRFVENY